MNIFYLDEDVVESAKYHVNKHIVKMPLETAQILCSVHHFMGTNSNTIPYKKTHLNHPSSVWARMNVNNYLYLASLGLELSKEYEYRYGKVHGSKKVIEWSIKNIPSLSADPFTPPTPAMKDEYKIYSNGDIDSLLSYRNYYKKSKSHLFEWKKRTIPYWLK